MSGDPYFESVKLLLHMDGADNGTTFTDVTGRTVTRANAVTKQAIKKFGTASAYFDGSGDYLTVPYHTDLVQWWTEDFTIEAWVYASSWSSWSYLVLSNPIPTMVGHGAVSSNTNYWSFGPISTGKLRFYYFNGSVQIGITSVGNVPLDAWAHICAVKNSSGVRLFIDGVAEGPFSISGTPQAAASQPLAIGQINNRSVSGYVDDLRITKGVARYTSTFDVPTEAFPDFLFGEPSRRSVSATSINRAALINNRIHYQGL